jgi:putative tryptophan/tyrosine transport system substrate-binding protein
MILPACCAPAAKWRPRRRAAIIGFLRSSRVEGFADLPEAMRAGLRESGYEVGRNVAIEYRWGDEQPDRLPVLVDELIRKPVAVIVANGVAVVSVKAATTTVPVVFVTGTDPVRDGWVTSFNRPGWQPHRHQFPVRRDGGQAAGAAPSASARRSRDRRPDRSAHQ